jgi:DNA mismatch repair protein MutS
VIRAARKNLALLEEHGLAAGPQRDLFAAAASAAAASADAAPNDAAAHRILDALRAADPDALSPKEALELVYRLRRELDE